MIGPHRGFPLPGARRKPVVTYALLGINSLVWIASYAAGGPDDRGALLDLGAMFGPLIADGQYWRLFTAIFLHIGLLHMALNSLALFIFGRLVEAIFGPARFAAIYLIAGLGGSVASYLFNSVALAAGASGAIFGVLGALTAFFYVQRNVMGEMAKRNLMTLLALAGINLVFGLLFPGVDNWAHLGGFVFGAALGLRLAPRYEPVKNLLGQVVTFRDRNSLVRQLPVLGAAAIAIASLAMLATATLPDNALTRTYSADRLFEQGNYTEALDELARAQELDPIEPKVYYVRGKVYAEAGDLDRARLNLRLAMRNARLVGDENTYEKALDLLERTG